MNKRANACSSDSTFDTSLSLSLSFSLASFVQIYVKHPYLSKAKIFIRQLERAFILFEMAIVVRSE